jgi:hypothetical protein
MTTILQLFMKYCEYYTPTLETDYYGNTRFCKKGCTACKVKTECDYITPEHRPKISKHQFKKVQKNNPELLL